ncbi:MAG: oligosaccharide flippase family protein, partial [Gammaproteobacteria bacterium]
RAMWMGALMLGLSGMSILWLLRESVAHWVFGNGAHTSEVGWLGLGLLLSLIAGSQTSTLQGLRRVGDMAKVSILSALFSAVLGILAVFFLGEDGVIWFVLLAPGANFLVASYYTGRIKNSQASYDLAAIRQQWLALLKLGIPLMTAGLITLITQLAVRSIVLRELGLDASGFFQAAWAISFTYVGFVLNAMAMDYFPRLTKSITDHGEARTLVNQQAEMALLLIGPALMAMITLAPWVIHLLYAPEFGPAAEILRWQVLGDMLKVVSVPMVFIFLATGRGGVAIGVQVVWSAAYLLPVLFGIPKFGLVMAGAGFWMAYLVYFCVVALLAYKLIGFKLSRRNSLLTVLLLLAGGIIMSLAGVSTIVSYSFGSVVTLLVSFYSFYRLNHLIDLTGWLRQRFQ